MAAAFCRASNIRIELAINADRKGGLHSQFESFIGRWQSSIQRKRQRTWSDAEAQRQLDQGAEEANHHGQGRVHARAGMSRMVSSPAVAAEGVINIRTPLLQALLCGGNRARNNDVARLDIDLMRTSPHLCAST